jgi:hypothetical protein
MTTFDESMDCLIDAMTQTLPEFRPDLETLQFARKHIHSSSMEFASSDELNLFYDTIIDANKSTMKQYQSADDGMSGTTSDDSSTTTTFVGS